VLLVPFLGERSGVSPRPAAHCPQQQEDLLDAWEQEDVEWGIVESLQELGELARTAGLQACVGVAWWQGSMRHFVFPPFVLIVSAVHVFLWHLPVFFCF